MKKSDFKIGKYFYTGAGKWLVVDKGKNVIVAVKVETLEKEGIYDFSDIVDHCMLFHYLDFPGCRKRPFKD